MTKGLVMNLSENFYFPISRVCLLAMGIRLQVFILIIAVASSSK